jgi:hypothetical protein
MQMQRRKVLLLVDNFSGHRISYEPKNVKLEFFAPNLTLFVQPLDAGIIWCFKAYYRRLFCQQMLGIDKADELKDEEGSDIYSKMSLLEAMYIAQDAWNMVTESTLRHCWKHAKIQG